MVPVNTPIAQNRPIFSAKAISVYIVSVRIPNNVTNCIGAQIRVIRRYQNSWDSFKFVSKFSTRNPTYWSIIGNINKVKTGTSRITQPLVIKEAQSANANKTEDQKGTADLKDNITFLSGITTTIVSFN